VGAVYQAEEKLRLLNKGQGPADTGLALGTRPGGETGCL
jgi:hypothetical protein